MVNSEVERLERVLLWWPPDSLRQIEDAGAWLMRRVPDLELMRQQCLALKATYESLGVEVVLVRREAPPNAVFARDAFTMSPQGAWMAHMAYPQRRPEQPHVAEVLHDLGVPRRGPPRGTFEGADALWVTPQDVLVGVGNRTTALEELSAWAPRVHPIPVPDGVQHLLGVITFFDRKRAMVRTRRVPTDTLVKLGVDIVAVDETDEVLNGRGMNFVAVAPSVVVIPANCPDLEGRLRKHGVEAHAVEVSEYLAADGGVACATGILARRMI